jgi:hypothetical protein
VHTAFETGRGGEVLDRPARAADEVVVMSAGDGFVELVAREFVGT